MEFSPVDAIKFFNDGVEWLISAQGYAYTQDEFGHRLFAHIVVMENMLQGPVPRGMLVDHINGITLDNRRENLRLADHAENSWNRRKTPHKGRATSLYKGVSRDGDRWQVHLQCRGQRFALGRYHSERRAAEVYDEHAMKHFGCFARLNFPVDLDHADHYKE